MLYYSPDGGIKVRLGIFALVTSLILLTYLHRPIILRFQEVLKYGKIVWLC